MLSILHTSAPNCLYPWLAGSTNQPERSNLHRNEIPYVRSVSLVWLIPNVSTNQLNRGNSKSRNRKPEKNLLRWCQRLPWSACIPFRIFPFERTVYIHPIQFHLYSLQHVLPLQILLLLSSVPFKNCTFIIRTCSFPATLIELKFLLSHRSCWVFPSQRGKSIPSHTFFNASKLP